MPRFLKLTRLKPVPLYLKQHVWINMDTVATMVDYVSDDGPHTRLFEAHDDDTYHEVRESPEQILEMLAVSCMRPE